MHHMPATHLRRLPAIASLTAAIKEAGDSVQGKVKVTLFDYQDPEARPQAAGTADVFVFPEGFLFQALPLEKLNATVVDCVAAAAMQRVGSAEMDGRMAALAGSRERGTTILVCCHARRDERCGHVGPPLADRLAAEVAARGLDGGLRVLKVSHVGGHVVSLRAITRQGCGCSFSCAYRSSCCSWHGWLVKR
jgi:hypothetical protein